MKSAVPKRHLQAMLVLLAATLGCGGEATGEPPRGLDGAGREVAPQPGLGLAKEPFGLAKQFVAVAPSQDRSWWPPIVIMIDMLDWMTLDSPDRDVNHIWDGGAFHLSTKVWPDKINYVKGFNAVGSDAWDINLYDDEYVYSWITEMRWFDPYSYKKFKFNTNVPMTKRWVHAGLPGEVIVSSVTDTMGCESCVCTDGRLGDYIIHETWGPITVNRNPWATPETWADVMVIRYYWNCSGPDNSTCLELEENWYEQHDGWIRHVPLHRNSASEPWPPAPIDPAWNLITPGSADPFFGCS